MAPTQVSQLDTLCRRWTDVIWMGVGKLRGVEGNKVKYIYYGILLAYGVWGLFALRITPNPLVLAIASGVMMNFALAISGLHTLYVLTALLPKSTQPGWTTKLGIAACSIFYSGISAITLVQQWPRIEAWLAK